MMFFVHILILAQFAWSAAKGFEAFDDYTTKVG